MAEANGEKRLGHAILTNLGFVWTIGCAVIAFACGYGAAWASNAGDHRVLHERDIAIEGRVTRCEEWQRDVGVKLDKIAGQLNHIEGALDPMPGK